jgi:uncharacterized protein (TIGR03435 family)
VRSLVVVTVFVATVAADASPQRPPADTPPTFAAASIKRSAPGASPMTTSVDTSPGGRWSARSATLRLILMMTYGVSREQIDRAPSWIDEERFDIVATAGADVAPDEVWLMVKQLLADRFAMRVHTESRPVDVYAMVLARPDGGLGPGLRINIACTTMMEARARGEDAPANQSRPCSRGSITRVDGVLRMRFTGYEIMNIIALAGLRAELGGVVVDRTGLTGAFDIDLDLPETPAATGGPVASGVLAAMERQLGLRFERRKELTDVLVVDDVSMPTPD